MAVDADGETGGRSPPLLARIPPDGATPHDVPSAVSALAGRSRPREVWCNELGGRTFQIGAGPGRRFVKWAPQGSGLDLEAEAVRLAWAGRYTAVPHVLEHGRDAEGAWLLTLGLQGESAVSERWKRQPARAVRALGVGLRALHDALPAADCPFSWSLDERLAAVERGRESIEPARWHAVHRPLGLARALDILASPPPLDRLVVCHGDACAPNTLIAGDGRPTGHVDLGALGVADRWADIAIATWSTEWNYGPGWERHLLDAYGIEPDPARTAYYRLLWDVGA